MGVLFRLGWRPALTPRWLLGLHSSPGGGWKGSEQLRLKGRDCSCSSLALLTNEGKYFLFNCFYCSSHLHPKHPPFLRILLSPSKTSKSWVFLFSLQSFIGQESISFSLLFCINSLSWLKEQVGMAVALLWGCHSACACYVHICQSF